jgi:prepilin-type N-terminal cleavage/methylation domain-containing protein
MLVRERRRGPSGFTLIEVLVGVVILGLIGAALAAISLTGVFGMRDGAQESEADALAAQQASLVLARDVQGARAVVSDCGTPPDRVHLIALELDVDPPIVVQYQRSSSRPYSLYRSVCGGEDRLLADDLSAEGPDRPPTVSCDGATPCVVTVDCDETSPPSCAEVVPPRTVTLAVGRTSSFDFALDGARRSTVNNESDVVSELPEFLSLGGDEPLLVQGGGGQETHLTIVGDAYINRPTDPSVADAVRFNGTARLTVTGDFRIQTPATCDGGCANANKPPGSFAVALPDPLRALPSPDQSGMPVHTDCPTSVVDGESRRVCQPGVYPTAFPPSPPPSNVKDYVLEPGIYVLQDGIQITSGSLVGDGVLLYNQSGSIDIRGAQLTLSAPTSGIYKGILLFQARGNTLGIDINGNTCIGTCQPETDPPAVLVGTMYAPSSTGFQLGSGNAGMRVGRIVGASLSVSGGADVTVGGS